MDLDDLTGLNRADVRDMPVLDSEATASRLLARALQQGHQLSVAGMRHSQGGHTATAKASVLLSEGLNARIDVSHTTKIATVDAGVTWAELHRALLPHRLCPPAQQSSPHFTVGGSISVNCHGRDPWQGPLSTTLVDIKVLCADGVVRSASPTEEPQLFRAVVGGYGSCGLIVRATLRLVDDEPLERIARRDSTLRALARQIDDMLARAPHTRPLRLFYAWLRCVPGEPLFDQVLIVEYKHNKSGSIAQVGLEDHAWGMSEMMRAAWAGAHDDASLRKMIWQTVSSEFEGAPCRYRSNWLRESVDFAANVTQSRRDMLFEYFLPAHKHVERNIRRLGEIARAHGINVLSATVRLVQPDTVKTCLSYARARPMISVAIDADIAVGTDGEGRVVPEQAAWTWCRESIDYVVEKEGTYYLPYYAFADRDLFRKAYASTDGMGWEQQQQAIEKYNPGKVFWNDFLARYF